MLDEANEYPVSALPLVGSVRHPEAVHPVGKTGPDWKSDGLTNRSIFLAPPQFSYELPEQAYPQLESGRRV